MALNSGVKRRVAALVIISATCGYAGTIGVPSDQPTIQAGIDAAADGDTVLVAPGTYNGEGNRNISTLGKQIVVMGQLGSDSTIIDVASDTIDGFHNEFFFDDTLAVIRGFTIRNGRNGVYLNRSFPRLVDVNCENNQGVGLYWAAQERDFRADSCRFYGNATGIQLTSAELSEGIFDNCVMSHNSGAGILYASQYRRENPAPTGLDMQYEQPYWVTFANTHIDSNGTGLERSGYAVLGMENCRLSGNGLAFDGGVDVINSRIESNESVAVLGFRDYLRFTNCAIENNSGMIASLSGYDHDPAWLDLISTTLSGNAGGISCLTNSRLVMDSCIYNRNGGPMSLLSNSGSTITRSTIAHNDSGGVVFRWMYGQPVDLTVEKNIIAFNSAFGIRDSVYNPIPYSCNDIFGNEADYVGLNNPVDIDGNLSVDPWFCDTAASDYSLYDLSPCTYEENDCQTTIGARGIGCSGAPVVETLVVLNEAVTNVVSHSPEFAWSYSSPDFLIQDSCDMDVGNDADWSEAEMWDAGPSLYADTSVTYAGDSLVDGGIYNARLRVFNGYAWSDWAYLTFRMNSVSAPALPETPVAEKVTVNPPELVAGSVLDPDGDSVRYAFEVYADSTLDSLVAASDTVGIPSTVWTVDDTLTENDMYWWRVRVFDGFEYSPFSLPVWFRVDALQEAPSGLQCLSPPESEGSIIYDMQPVFSWSPAIDPDPFDSVTYSLIVAMDSLFTFAGRVDGIQNIEYPWSAGLEFDRRYWWKVTAYDQTGDSTVSANVPSFWTWTLGDIDHDHRCDISDVTALVNNLFVTFDPIDPFKVADLTGDCAVDITDLSYLVAYLFGGGPPPVEGCSGRPALR